MHLRTLAAALLYTASLAAQVERGAVVGTVTDSSGGLMVNASIQVVNDATGVVFHAVTDAQGVYVAPNLVPGTYTVNASLAGFKSVSQRGIVVSVGQRVRADFVLTVGQVNESVEVTAQSPLIDSETSSLGTVITQRTIVDLPLNGRSFINLLPLSAGITAGRRGDILNGRGVQTRRGGSAFTANGMRDTSNNFLIDGIDNNEMAVNTIVYFPSIDAVQEFKVQTSASDAEFGRSGGGTVNLSIKSGTNELHGSVYEFLRNEKMDARNFFDPPDRVKPSVKRNQFGFSLGGPVRRNKTFYFGDYEARRFSEAETFVSTVPTAAQRTGDFTGRSAIFDPATYNSSTRERMQFPGNRIPASRFDRAGAAFTNLYPMPNASGIVRNYVINPRRTTRADQLDAKLDHYVSEKDNFFVRYSFADSDIFQPGELGQLGGTPALGSGTNKVPLHQIVATHTHMFSPTLLNTLRVGFTRFVIDHLPLNYGSNITADLGVPGVNVSPEASGLMLASPAGYQTLGDAQFTPALLKQNTWHISENLAWNRGSHSVKGGAEIRKRQLNFFQLTRPRGQMSFSPNITNNPARPAGTGDAVASMLLGYADNGFIDRLITGPYGQRYNEWGFFVKDDWKIRPDLTLNLGLRYELFTPMIEQYDRMSNFDYLNNRLVLPGQDGWPRGLVETDRNNFAPRAGFVWRPGFLKRVSIRGAAGIFYNIEASTGNRRLTENAPFLLSTQFANDQLNPLRRMSEGFPNPGPVSLNNPSGGLTMKTWDRNMPTGYTGQFNLSVDSEVTSNFVVRTRYAGTRGVHLVLFSNENAPLPGPGAVNPRRPFPLLGNFTALKTRGNMSYHSFQVEAERRFAKGLSFLTALTISKTIDDGDRNESDVQNPRNYAAEKALSRFHVGKRLVSSFVYELPFGRGKTLGNDWAGPLQWLLGGWQTNGVLSLQDGPPFEPQTIDNTNGAGSRRPDRIGNGNLDASQRTLERWFDKDAFRVPALYTYGNSGRNVLFGPGLVNLDFSAFKSFTFRERYVFQFRAEFFNFTNTPSFNLPNARTDLAAGGVISSADAPRRTQLGLKLTF